MTRLHLRSNAAYALGAALLAALLYSMLWIGAAHADTGAITPVLAEAPPPTWLVALAIGTSILAVLSTALHFIAPRTKNTWDDAASAKLDELLSVLRALPLPPVPQAAPAPAPPVTVNVAGPAALLAVLLLGLGAAAALPACHYDTVKADTTALAKGAVTCAKADLPAIEALGIQLTTEALVSVMAGHGIPWPQLEAEAEAGAKVHGIAVSSCAFGQLIADLARLLPVPGQGVAARSDDGRAELAAFKARLGVAEIRLGSGEVL